MRKYRYQKIISETFECHDACSQNCPHAALMMKSIKAPAGLMTPSSSLQHQSTLYTFYHYRVFALKFRLSNQNIFSSYFTRVRIKFRESLPKDMLNHLFVCKRAFRVILLLQRLSMYCTHTEDTTTSFYILCILITDRCFLLHRILF